MQLVYEVDLETVTDYKRKSLLYYMDSKDLSYFIKKEGESNDLFINIQQRFGYEDDAIRYWLESHNVSFTRESAKCYNCLYWTKKDRCTVYGLCIYNILLKDKFIRLENKERMEKIKKELKERK